jgi:hypothetical protein
MTFVKSTPFTAETVDAAQRYPLYCIDRGDTVKAEDQFFGPFPTHDDAHELAGPGHLVRRCRKLRPSELTSKPDAFEFAQLETFNDVMYELNETALAGELPECAFAASGQLVHGLLDDDTMPTRANFDAWVDAHLELRAWICEGDEP